MKKIWIEVILHKSVIIQVAYWPERKKSGSNSSMRLEEEEFKKSTQEPISNRLQVHHGSVDESKVLFARLSDVRSYTEDRSPEIKLISHTWW